MYTLPATLTLKNMKGVDESLTLDAYKDQVNPALDTCLVNTGLEAIATGEALHPAGVLDVPDNGTAASANTIQIPIYGNQNQYHTLKPSEEFKVTVHSDAEAIFYLQMHQKGVLEVAEHASLFDESSVEETTD